MTNSKCPLGSLHYGFLCTRHKGPRKDPHGAWFLAWMWVVDMLLKLNGPFSDQLMHLWDTTIPYCLSFMHMSLWLCVLAIIRRYHKVKVSLKSLPFASSFVVHTHPAIEHCLHFVSMTWTSRLLESSKIFQKHMYIFYYYYYCHHDYE